MRQAWRGLALLAVGALTMGGSVALAHDGGGHGNGNGNGNGKDHDFARNMTVGRSFCAHAAERVRTRLHSLATSPEEDERVVRTADAVLGWPTTGNGDAAR